jgi:hypothetical protein
MHADDMSMQIFVNTTFALKTGRQIVPLSDLKGKVRTFEF